MTNLRSFSHFSAKNSNLPSKHFNSYKTLNSLITKLTRNPSQCQSKESKRILKAGFNVSSVEAGAGHQALVKQYSFTLLRNLREKATLFPTSCWFIRKSVRAVATVVTWKHTRMRWKELRQNFQKFCARASVTSTRKKKRVKGRGTQGQTTKRNSAVLARQEFVLREKNAELVLKILQTNKPNSTQFDKQISVNWLIKIFSNKKWILPNRAFNNPC